MALVAGSCYGQPVYVEAPDVEPLKFGIFSVADMLSFPEHGTQGLEWQPQLCGPAQTYGCPGCAQNNVGGNPVKTYSAGPGLGVAFPFTVIGSFACSPIGSWDIAQERARQQLRNGAERAVELQLANGVHVASPALVDAGTVDVTPTPGTPVTIQQGFALLESYIGANASGQGVILANRRDVALASADHLLQEPRGTQLETYLGTPVAALGGFNGRTGPNSTAAAAGNAWLFALGSRPRIWRGDVFDTPPNRENGLNTSNNNLQLLSEQTYAIGWDCFTAAVLVTSV